MFYVARRPMVRQHGQASVSRGQMSGIEGGGAWGGGGGGQEDGWGDLSR